MCLSVQQCVLGDHVVLNVHALLIKVGAQVGNEFFKSLHAGQCRGVELLVKQRAVGGRCMVETGYRVGSCGRSEGISAGRRADTVRNGGVGESAVGGCTGLVAQRHVRGYGVQTSLENTAAAVGELGQDIGVGLANLASKGVNVLKVVAVLGQVGDHFADLLIFLLLILGDKGRGQEALIDLGDLSVGYVHACQHKLLDRFHSQLLGLLGDKALTEVVLNRFLIVSHGDLLGVKDQCLDSQQTVGVVGNTKALRTGEVESCTALLVGLAACHTVVDQGCLEGQGATNAVRVVYCVVSLYHHLDKEFLLGFVSLEEVLKAAHFAYVTRLGADLLALVHTIREYHFHRTAHVEERSIVPTVGIVGNAGLNAADDAVAAGILERNAAIHHSGDDDLIIIEGGHAHTLAGNGCSLDQKIVGGFVPYTDGKRRLGQAHVALCLHAHKGELVGDVIAVLVLTADDQVLEHAVACKALSGSCVTHLVEVVELDPDAVQQLLCGFKGLDTAVDIVLEPRIHISVKGTGRDRVAAGFQLQDLLHEPECLASLVKASCGLTGNLRASLGNAQKLLLTCAGGFGSHVISKLCVSVSVCGDSLCALNDSLKEVLAGQVIALTHIQLGHFLLSLADHALHTEGDDLFVVYANVADAVVEIVTDRKNAVVEENIQAVGVHVGGSQVADRLTVPVGMYLFQSCYGLGRDVEGVSLTGGNSLVLRAQPLEGIFGIGLASTRGDRVCTDDQLVGTDDDRDIFKNVTQSGTSSLDNGEIFGFLIALGHKLCTIRLDFGELGIQMLDQARDTIAFGDLKFDFCHNTSSLSLDLVPKLLVGSGNYSGVSKHALILGMSCACLDGSGHVTNVAYDQHDTLTAHTAGGAQLVDLDLCGLDSNIGCLDGTCGREGLNDAETARLGSGLRAEHGGNHGGIDATHDAGVDQLLIKSALDVLDCSSHVCNRTRENDLEFTGTCCVCRDQLDACTFECGIGCFNALCNAFQFNNSDCLIHIYTYLILISCFNDDPILVHESDRARDRCVLGNRETGACGCDHLTHLDLVANGNTGN